MGKNIKSIGEYGFANCTSLKTMTIPDNVTSIEKFAFYNCNSLTSVNIPDSVISIEDSSFNSCSALKSILIPDSVTTIGINAFARCNLLESVTLGKNVSSVGSGAFQECPSLTSIVLNSNGAVSSFNKAFPYSNYTQIKIGNSVTSIGNDIFSSCTNLQYNEEDNALYLGSESNDFYALIKATNESINSCIINENTIIIANNAFYKCNNLKNIDITLPKNKLIVMTGVSGSGKSFTYRGDETKSAAKSVNNIGCCQ